MSVSPNSLEPLIPSQSMSHYRGASSPGTDGAGNHEPAPDDRLTAISLAGPCARDAVTPWT